MSCAAQGLKAFVCGAGSIGERHLRNLKSLGVDNITVFDADSNVAQTVSDKYRVLSSSTYEAGFENKPDFVIIASPTHLHVQHSMAAIQRNVPVFVEKPLSHSWEQVDLLCELTDKSALVNMVGCNMRFKKPIAMIKRLLEEQKVGKVYSINVTCGYYLPHWRPQIDYRKNYGAKVKMGGGVIFDSIHEIDYLCWFFGRVADVSAFSDKVSDLEIETEDFASISLRFQTGPYAHIHLDYLNRKYTRMLEIVGQYGSIRWDWHQPQIEILGDNSSNIEQIRFEDEDVNQMYIDEMRYFIDVLQEGGKTMCDFKEAREVLRVAMAAKKSSRNRQTIDLESAFVP